MTPNADIRRIADNLGACRDNILCVKGPDAIPYWIESYETCWRDGQISNTVTIVEILPYGPERLPARRLSQPWEELSEAGYSLATMAWVDGVIEAKARLSARDIKSS